MGLKALRKGYTPAPYHRKDKEGTHIALTKRAEEAAHYLSTVQWGQQADENNPSRHNNGITEPVDIKQGDIEEDERNRAIKKLKQRKCGGPDGTSIELFKAMDEGPRKEVLGILNKWWSAEAIDKEALRARVVHIYKKGNTSDLANYRPISLLNTMYKIFTVIVQETGIDSRTHGTQYGFRKARSTQHAIHIIRRILEAGESTTNKLLLVLLDWEKAFDKLTREGLFTALERANLPPKIIRIIQAIYANPEFQVEIEGEASTWKAQATGIRQGCPLSPYLFIIYMTIMFADVKDKMRGCGHQHKSPGS